MLDLKRGGTFDAALDVMSVQKGVAPVAAHAAAASQVRTSGAIGLGAHTHYHTDPSHYVFWARV